MNKKTRILLAVLAVLISTTYYCMPSHAEEVVPTAFISADAQERTPEARLAEAAVGLSTAPTAVAPFLPTMGYSNYMAAKSIAARAPLSGRTEAPAPLAPPVLKTHNFKGANQTETGGWRPPDTHGAVGKAHFVEVTNSHIDAYRKSDEARVMNESLATFFGYNTTALFDPRVIYDSTWNRWIVTADSFPDANANTQRFFIAISQTSNPLGAYWIYVLGLGNNTDLFYDFPMVGMDQDSILFTGNRFAGSAGSYIDTSLFAVAKARLYNGWGFGVPYFTGLAGTLAPSIVLDQNKDTFLVAASGGTTITKYTLDNSSRAWDATLTSSTITVPSYAAPANAAQPGTTHTLDTSDGRFVNAGTQVGDSLFQVHTIALGGYPAPKFYEFNTATDTVTQSGFFYASQTSYDFNASIAANASGDVYVTWSATDPTNSKNAQVRFSGRRAADTAGVIGAGAAISTSPTFYIGGEEPARWGDYSAVSVDPTNSLRAWIVNETILNNTTWGSRIGQIGY